MRARASAGIEGAIDDTDALIDAYARAAAAPHAPAPASTAGTCFLFLRGMAHRLDREHFRAMSRRFTDRGVCAEVVDGPIDANFGESAPQIADAILRHENVVLIGHSKGGLNALETVSLAYRTNETALTSRVRAIVTLQTPFACAPTADRWLKIPGGVYGALSGLYRWWTHGREVIPSRDALDEVSCEERAHPPRMLLPPEIKLFSIATSFPLGVPGIVGPEAEKRARYVKSRTGEDNDGYVAPDRGLVPGSRFALLDRLTHTDLVTSDAKVYGPKYWSLGKDPDFATRLFPDALLDWISRD